MTPHVLVQLTLRLRPCECKFDHRPPLKALPCYFEIIRPKSNFSHNAGGNAQRNMRRRERAARAYAEQAEQLRTTLASIGDGVISTDVAGRITNLNSVAESLTGWKHSEAVGQPIEAVFRIVNEESGQTIENSVKRAMQKGAIVGLANRSVLIAKDGSDRPIDDSAAPIRCKEGEIVGCVLVFRDVTVRNQLERLNEERLVVAQRLSSIVDSSNDAIISKSLDGIIQTWNVAAERLFGHPAEQAIGRHISLLFPSDRLDEEDLIITRLRAGERIEHYDTVRVRSDGQPVQVSLTISPLRDAEGRIVGASKIVRDITERKEMEGKLHQLVAQLSDSDRRKDEFLAILAHELRNPLAPIRNGLQVLKMVGDEAATVKEVRSMMERQMSQLVRLIDDLMDVSRITRGKLELRMEQVKLAAVLESAVETSRPLIEETGQELTFITPNQQMIVAADPTRLSQVFMNLLNNAAKYSDRGSHIWLTSERQGNEVVVTVKDSGIGINADQLPHIFEMFRQVHSSLAKSQGGLGIGLTLVKRLVELHGGSIEARSDGLGQGSEFTVTLPLATDASLLNVIGDGEERPLKSSFRILIVDDNQDGANSLAVMLRPMGNESRTAYDGQQGIELAGDFRPDVILLDIGLPNLNGYEVCRQIREQPWGECIVMIAVTGWGQDKDRHRSEEAGFNHHLVKPVDPADLMKMLAGLQIPKQK
ncbi:MAG: Histidine kinase [Planctomycetaceae bacterium]|nr:Histidine kinase [Planctomycetaceae bacterium]